jgi:hypothetical protein
MNALAARKAALLQELDLKIAFKSTIPFLSNVFNIFTREFSDKKIKENQRELEGVIEACMKYVINFLCGHKSIIYQNGTIR